MPTYAKPIEIHEKLNPNLWTNENLKPEVQQALLRIAREFYKFLEVSSKMKDILITGSQANFNYSSNSDIDLHLIFDFNEIDCDEPIAELFDTKRKLWREKHDIEIYDIPVEVYVENLSTPAVSSAYSIVSNQWIRHPKKPIISYNVDKVKYVVSKWTSVINSAVRGNNLEVCSKIQRLLSNYRRIGLKKHGEFGVPNLVYKSLRNAGLIKKLSERIIKLEDEKLSLD